jgi:hypothetical protein
MLLACMLSSMGLSLTGLAANMVFTPAAALPAEIY